MPAHNIVFLGARLVNLTFGGHGGASFYEVPEKSDITGIVACFRNEAVYGEIVKPIHNARAHLKFFDSAGAEVATSFSHAFWLGEKVDLFDLVPGGKVGCVIAVTSKAEKFTAPSKHRVSSGWGDTLKDEFLDFSSPPHVIEISLLDANNQLLLPPVQLELSSSNKTLAVKSLSAMPAQKEETANSPETKPVPDHSPKTKALIVDTADHANQGRKPWTRDQIIGLLIAIFTMAAIVTGIATPEIRRKLRLEKPISTISIKPSAEKPSQANSQVPLTQRIDRNVVVAGMVIDERTRAGVAQASIHVDGHPEQYTTEDNGNFRITLSEEDSAFIRLHVTKSGYHALDQTVRVPADSLTLPLQRQ